MMIQEKTHRISFRLNKTIETDCKHNVFNLQT